MTNAPTNHAGDPAPEIVLTYNRSSGHFSLKINGDEFPYPISADGVSLQVRDTGDRMPYINLSIPASKLRIYHEV